MASLPTLGGTRTQVGVPRRPEPTPTPSSPAQQQVEALRNPDPVTTSTPVNPMQQEAFGMGKESYGAAKGLAEGITAGTNEEITRELGRARDEISSGMLKEGEAAMGRGADPSLFRSRALGEGARNLSNLQGRLAGVALDKRQAAVNAQTGAAANASGSAAAAAGEQRALHLGSAAQRLADSRESRERAESQARLNQAPFDRMLQLFGAAGQFGGAFSGLSAGPTGTPLSGPAGPTLPLGPTSRSGGLGSGRT